ncbi:uncharacterized protein Aud_010094 [Aspergillus udagawae]|uniref:Uncharacterized protein n=1 Tax=Aspergillus udagawae TaxID=91492 RepID=A0A8E0R2P2_9EURO|nr:uncharacterized protein Aud_010094 [Aspergillus udagawae]GIC93606.1 hypothetical protein Aud_010094 [Aspergillus udagawae]
MTAIKEIRNQLPTIRHFGPGLVVVFVGGTSGIGESTAREFVRYAVSPRVYLIGRSQEAATRIQREFQELNSSSEVRFIKADVSQLRSVDDVCQQIKAQETKINLLFLSAGIFHYRGREETPEGLDRRFALDFYSRLRFTENMLPLLREVVRDVSAESNAQSPRLASVVSVLGAGREKSIDTSDLPLKHKYSLGACTQHATTMTTLSFARLAADQNNAGITFFHTRPGIVKTNADRELGTAFRVLLGAFSKVFKAWTVPVRDAGERGLWAATSSAFEPGQLHLVAENSERLNNGQILKQLEDDGTSSKIWEHTRDVFQAICYNPAGKYQQ